MTHYEFALAFDPIDAKILKRNFTVAEMEADLQGLSDIDRDYDNHMKWYLRTDRKCRKCFEDNGELLRDVCRAAYPSISREDEDAALGRVYARLDEYQDTSRKFKAWAKKQVTKEAARLDAFRDLQSHYRMFALDGIWSVLHGCGDLGIDERTTIAELLAHVWRSVWDKLDSLLEPNQPAKVSTRVWEFGYWAARGWKTDQLRRKKPYEYRQKQKAEFDAANKPQRIVRPSLDRIEAVPAPDTPEPDFWVKELEPVRETACDAEPEVSNTPAVEHYRYRALFCPACKRLERVRTIEDDIAELLCSHRRSTDWLPEAKVAWERRAA